MLAIPVPRKHHKSFHFTLSSSLLKITIMIAMRTLVTMARKMTTSMEVKPHGVMDRTSNPMHPHKIPAASTHSGESIDFLLFFPDINKFLFGWQALLCQKCLSPEGRKCLSPKIIWKSGRKSGIINFVCAYLKGQGRSFEKSKNKQVEYIQIRTALCHWFAGRFFAFPDYLFYGCGEG